MIRRMFYDYLKKIVCVKLLAFVILSAILLCTCSIFLVSCEILKGEIGEKTQDDNEVDANVSDNSKISLVLPVPEDSEKESETQNSESEGADMPSYEEALTTRKSLSYISNENGTCTVCGVGSITDMCIVIPERSPEGDIVTGVSPMAFYGNHDIVAIEIPKSVKEIGRLAFADCPKLAYISVDVDNGVFCDLEGILYDKEGTALICCPDAFGGDRINISEKVKKIHYMALYNCSAIKRIDYNGTREEWELISVEEKNYVLLSASVSFGNK